MVKHKNGVNVLTTLDIIKAWFSKRKRFENKQSLLYNLVPPEPPGEKIVTIAIILNDEVQEIIKAQSGLAALFLSNPSFAEIVKDPEGKDFPDIGWKYIDGKFLKQHVFIREGEAVWSLGGDACGECDDCISGGMLVASIAGVRVPNAVGSSENDNKELGQDDE
jgi:hypothetical protein